MLHLSILQLLIMILCALSIKISAGKDCRILKLAPLKDGTALQGHVIQSLMVAKGSACVARCYVEENCVSYNLGPQLVDGKYMCELSNSDHVVHPTDLVRRFGFIYQSTENPCYSSPCPNGSVCQNGFTVKGYRCVQGHLFVTITPQTDIAEVGEHVKFTCNVKGQFNPVITWSKPEGSLPVLRTIVSEGYLTILNVTTDDSGSYVCTATSIVGTNSSSVQLQIFSALKFITRPPASVLVYVGQTLNLSCSASSGLQPTVTWVFNGSTSLPEGAATDSWNNLIIVSAVITHGGNFTCSATNLLGSLHAIVAVHVKIPETCSRVKANISDVSGDYVIDPDGEQGESPFTVYCNMIDKGGVGVTAVSHDSEDRTHVNGFDPAGSYRRDINYNGTSLSQLKVLTAVSRYCQQFIKYECFHSAIYFKTRTNFWALAWWISRDGEQMTYWGRGVTQGCECRVTQSCANPDYLCNCDMNDNVWREDSGLLTNKSHLPVSQLRFGDTGRSHEEGYHTLGKLKCYGIAGHG